MIKEDANIDIENNEGHSALSYAVLNRNISIINLLIKNEVSYKLTKIAKLCNLPENSSLYILLEENE